jgi:hypothetical protein
VFTEPAAKLFGIASFPKGQREAGGGVDQKGSVGTSVESEVVDPQDLGRDQRRKLHPHQLGQECNPGKLDVQDPKHPGSAPACQDHADVLDQGLQLGCSPLVAHGQTRYLLGEGHLRAGRVLTVQAAYGQVDAQRAASERDVGEASCVAAVAPLAEPAASRASRRFTGSRAGINRHGGIGYLNRNHLHVGQLR